MKLKQLGYPCLVLLIVVTGLFSLGASHAQQTPVPVKAVIKGPEKVLAGTLLFLSAQEATGDNSKWLIPPELTETSATCGDNIFFAIPTPGKYTFGLVVANKAAEIDIAYHSVTVVMSLGGTPTPPDTPQPPVSNFDNLIKVSKDAVQKLNDPPTATALKQALLKIVTESGNKTLEQLRLETVKATTTVFLSRTGDSEKKEWGLVWAVPVDNLIITLAPKDSSTYVQLLQALASSF